MDGGTPPAEPEPSEEGWRADLDEIASLVAEMEAGGAADHPAPTAPTASPASPPPSGPASASTALTDADDRFDPGAAASSTASTPTTRTAGRRLAAILAGLGSIPPRAAAVTLVVALAGGSLAAVEVLRSGPAQGLRPGGTPLPTLSPGQAPGAVPTLLVTPQVSATAAPPPSGQPPAAPPAEPPGPASAAVPQGGGPAPAGPAPRAALPAPRPPAATALPSAAPSSPPPATPAPSSAPSPSAAPTPAPTPRPTATPAPPGFAVTAASLVMGTCTSGARGWTCPYRATFTVTRGAGGTISWHLVGQTATCAGATSRFDLPQSAVQVPASGPASGPARVTQTGSMLVPGSGHPASMASGKGPSMVLIHVTGPDDVRSAPQRFYGAACP